VGSVGIRSLWWVVLDMGASLGRVAWLVRGDCARRFFLVEAGVPVRGTFS